MSIHQAICHTRLSLGISQTDLAVRAGLSLATLQNLEAGRANPSLSTLEKLPELLQPLVSPLPAHP